MLNLNEVYQSLKGIPHIRPMLKQFRKAFRLIELGKATPAQYAFLCRQGMNEVTVYNRIVNMGLTMEYRQCLGLLGNERKRLAAETYLNLLRNGKFNNFHKEALKNLLQA